MYYIQAFLYIFMLQAVLSLGVNYTVMRVSMMSSAAMTPLGFVDFVGFSMFAAGFLCETLGDA